MKERDSEQQWTWPLPPSLGSGLSNDRAHWQQLFDVEAQRLNLSRRSLGEPFGQPLWLCQRPAATAVNDAGKAPRRLLACGFHGEEPAGPWGLVTMLQQLQPAQLDGLHFSLLPLVNASGFLIGTRFNQGGDNPNRGFIPHLSGMGPSAEGQLLLQQADLLAQAGRDGVLSCHEDVLVDKAYIYSFEHANKPGPFSQRLLQANLQFFEQHPDGDVDECSVRGGIVFNNHDGSFEDWMFSLGVKEAACVETPGQQDFAQRVQAQALMMRTFLLAA